MKYICIIGMRGGSQGVPNKNIRNMWGKPLCAYTIEQALLSNLFEHIVVSTDSDEIATIAEKHGAQAWFRRPLEMASCEAAKLPVIRHAVQEAEKHFDETYDVVCELDATSPLRDVEDIRNSMDLFINGDYTNLITATPSRKSPYFNMIEQNGETYKLVKELKSSVVRRQDAPKTYDMNASIYVWWRKNLFDKDSVFQEKTALYEMPEERSIDIDSPTDWNYVEYLMNKDKKNAIKR